jgi:tetratricopeptide (TPR) repeat protein
LRALSPFNEAVRTLVSSRGDLTLVDLEQDFRSASGPGLVGTDLFVDYCHPNPAGHRVAARSLARALPGAAPDARAAAALETAIARDSCPPQDADHLAVAAYALGMTSQNNGLDQPAEQAYREALRHRPAFPEAESNLGVLLRKRGAAAEAEDHFRRALRIDPDDSVALFQLAVIALEQGRLDEAAVYPRRILSGNPENPQARELLGDVAARKGSWSGALADYQEAASQGGESGDLRVKLGEAYHALGREREAAREWSLALELRPDDERTRAFLERSRLAAGGGAPSEPPRPTPPGASPMRSP